MTPDEARQFVEWLHATFAISFVLSGPVFSVQGQLAPQWREIVRQHQIPIHAYLIAQARAEGFLFCVECERPLGRPQPAPTEPVRAYCLPCSEGRLHIGRLFCLHRDLYGARQLSSLN